MQKESKLISEYKKYYMEYQNILKTQRLKGNINEYYVERLNFLEDELDDILNFMNVPEFTEIKEWEESLNNL